MQPIDDGLVSAAEIAKADYIIKLIKGDELRMAALGHVASLNLPDCFIAAGFIRNLVWDHLHHKPTPTPLNDVDVIYFATAESNPEAYLDYEAKLKVLQPQLNWQVRNQTHMHVRNNDQAYSNSLDAMSYWPEYETAIGVRLLDHLELELVSAFGLASLFALQITPNPKRARVVCEQRIAGKGWLSLWPKLTLQKKQGHR